MNSDYKMMERFVIKQKKVSYHTFNQLKQTSKSKFHKKETKFTQKKAYKIPKIESKKSEKKKDTYIETRNVEDQSIILKILEDNAKRKRYPRGIFF